MTETMTPTLTGLLCPSCENPMAFTEVTHSYRCHACNPIPENVPECATQKCKRPLTRLGDPWNCWICLKCNKHPEEVNKMRKEEDQKKRKYLDKKLTTEDVSEMIKAEMVGVKDMIREALAEQRPAYPPTQVEIQTMTAPENVNAKPVEKPETWMQKAKRLGVQTHIPDGRGMRKKAEIMADIESLGKEETIEEANTFREKAQSPPGEDAEFARGLTEADMM